jgi:hypothetical protein
LASANFSGLLLARLLDEDNDDVNVDEEESVDGLEDPAGFVNADNCDEVMDEFRFPPRSRHCPSDTDRKVLEYRLLGA